MTPKKIKSALLSVYSKDGLAPIVKALHQFGVKLYSTGGTQKFIENLGIEVEAVENITSYPSILDGRVKTLHPKVFGGLLARREAGHLAELAEYDIPEIDLVVVDLYPFEETVASTDEEAAIIEKIDIGGISLIRAAAKNYKDVVVVPSRDQYQTILNLIETKEGHTDLEDRKALAKNAFQVSSHYDVAIYNHFNSDEDSTVAFKQSVAPAHPLRYGENPHQKAVFYGNFEEVFNKRTGKDISFNNLVDIDAAVNLMAEFKESKPTFAVLKHTNACGVATRDTLQEAWQAALAGDNISAFGGILIANQPIDLATAEEINQLFYEVLIAPSFNEDAFELLAKKSKRILLELKQYPVRKSNFKSLLNGVVEQDPDNTTEDTDDLKVATIKAPSQDAVRDLIFAAKCCKHLKSNTIVLAKGQQLIGMGCGQTSRVDALNQAILKAKAFGFDLNGAVMASDAFFPFPDCVEIADKAGIVAIIQPGGSIKDQLSIDYCNNNDLAMMFSGIRHFKH